MLKENKILNGSLKPPQGSRRTFFQKPGQWTRWAAFDWNEKYEESFYSFHIHAGLLHGPSFNLSKSSSGSVFSHLKEHILLKKKRENQFLFQLPPSTSPSPSSPDLPPSEKESSQRWGGGVAFSMAFRPPSLSNSSRPSLLCMKHRSRLKAFSGHSDAEEKRSSELY